MWVKLSNNLVASDISKDISKYCWDLINYFGLEIVNDINGLH
jgi:hypothetical protein